MRSVFFGALMALLASAFSISSPTTLYAEAALSPNWLAPPPAYTFRQPASCPELARRQTLYRVCDDQMAIFSEALATARREGKLLLVTFGATWCPSCKSLHQGLETPAAAEKPVAAQFVRVEIAISTLKDGRRLAVESGDEVLRLVLMNTPQSKPRSVPFIAVVDPDNRLGTFTRHLEDAEHGPGGEFDLDRVREILAQAEQHVRTGAAAPSEPSWLQRKLKRWFSI